MNLELEIEVEKEEYFLKILHEFKKRFGNLILDIDVIKIYKEHKLKYLPDISLIT